MAAATVHDVMRAAVDHHRAGRLAAAEAAYLEVVGLDPNYSDALHMLGLLAVGHGQPERAVELIRRAIVHRPDNPEAYFNLGVALDATGDAARAREAWAAAVRQRPTYVDALRRLGDSYQKAARWDDAIAALKRAVELDPRDAAARALLGATLRERGRPDEAISTLTAAIGIDPGNADAHANLAIAFGDVGRLADALAAARAAVRLGPTDAHVHSNLCYALHYHPDVSPTTIRDEHSAWRRRHADPLLGAIAPHPNDCEPGRPLRVGYVSSDLVLHPVARLLLPVLRAHDRSRFSVHLYSTGSRRDAFTDRVKAAGDGWHDCSTLSDEAVAGQVRADRIDILVDLSLHSAHNRLRVFARKPAPVQVSWLGYPSTTGLTTIDHRFGDAVLDPPGEADDLYTERTVRLPTYWCYAVPDGAPAVADPPSAKRGHVTFGSLNNFLKVNDPLIALWATLLKRVPEAKLLLHSKPGGHWKTTHDKFAAAGVDPRRVSFVGFLPYEHYFRQYHNIDVALDTMPYGGGITTCDALYMGVPVVTRLGATAVGRVGASMLTAVGLDELVAANDGGYVEIAAGLAADRPRLADLRRTLRGRMATSPLMDAAGFTTAVEAAYRRMWDEHCASVGAPGVHPGLSSAGGEP